MSRSRSIDDFIKDTEYTLAKYHAVKAQFPDAKVNLYNEFSSKSVNKDYTKFSFERRYGGLFVSPYCEVKFTYNDKEEIIKVHSSPRTSRLAYLRHWGRMPSFQKTMKFSRLAFNLKNNQFKDEMLNACRAEIMKFIRDNPGFKLDDKHLEPRLKKLILFT